jgi:hypothetical protein
VAAKTAPDATSTKTACKTSQNTTPAETASKVIKWCASLV